MISVLDTSVVLRLFIADGPLLADIEALIADAQRGNHRLIAPQLMLAEVVNVLRRRTQSAEINAEEGEQILQCILELPVSLFDHATLAQDSYELALEHGLTGYDGMFLALARQQNARLYSYDRKLLKAAQAMQLA